MTKAPYATFFALAFLFVSISLRAQTGCVDSPEAPTNVLLLVGAVGMFYGSSVLMRVLGRRVKK
jgi:XrtJ-associated TM-motif-TM protein